MATEISVFWGLARIPHSMDAILLQMSTVEEQGRALERGLRQRDPAVLEALVEQYQYRRLRHLVHLCGNRALAEDLFQETWLHVLERGRQYRRPLSASELTVCDCAQPVSGPGAASNPSRPGRRSTRKMRPRRSPISTPASPFDLYCHQQEQAGYGTPLARLAAPCREVLTLRFQEELSLEEIAGIVEVPISTVKSRLYRGGGPTAGLDAGERGGTGMTLSCAEAETRLLEAVAERWPGDAALQAHLESCPGCRDKFEQLQQIARQVRAVRVEPNPALAARTQALLRQRSAELLQKRRLFVLVGAAGVVYLLLNLIWFGLAWDLAGAFLPVWSHSPLFRFGVAASLNLLPVAILMVLLLFMEESGGWTSPIHRKDTSYV